MDMSFANQSLCVEYLAKQEQRLAVGVYVVPREIDDTVARLKLASMGITIDDLTDEQRAYLASWESGT
jgi:adenosylhomocysteinase